MSMLDVPEPETKSPLDTQHKNSIVATSGVEYCNIKNKNK
jgi:hypothetical protein